MSGYVGVDLLEWCNREADRQVLGGTKVLEVQWWCLDFGGEKEEGEGGGQRV